MKISLQRWEIVLLSLCAVLLLIGYITYWTSISSFLYYTQEDGIVEWFTVLGLLAGSFICFSRFFRLIKKRNAWFLFVSFGIGLFLFFAAGEEISWGQRIFHIKTPEYFLEHNAQKETNLHNLIVDGVKVNKLVFSLILVSALALYLVVVPILYKKSPPFAKFFTASGLPIPHWYQVVAFAVMFIFVSLIRNGKSPEISECDGAILFFWIIANPVNKSLFNSNWLPKS